MTRPNLPFAWLVPQNSDEFTYARRMTRRHFIVARVVLCGALCLLMVAAAFAQRGLPKHLEEAQELVKHLALTETEYRHKDTVVRWKGVDDAKHYEVRTDCSGFIDALLEHCYGLTRADFKRWTGRARPLANTY